jgi:hypothetical protein
MESYSVIFLFTLVWKYFITKSLVMIWFGLIENLIIDSHLCEN